MEIYKFDELWSRCEIEFVENERKENVINDDAVMNQQKKGGKEDEN